MSIKLYIFDGEGKAMSQLRTTENGYRSRICTNLIRLICWEVAWLLATALMRFGPLYLWKQTSVLTLLAIGLNVAVGIGMILVNKSYVAQLDELQQKVYLNALGITVGVTVIVGVPFSVMGLYHVISFHAEIWHLLMLMGLTFMVSIAYGTWRYR
jgi:hypothetical protein